MTSTLADETGLLSRVAIRKPALLSVIAYAAIMMTGALLLTLPVMRDASRSEPVGFIDALFISVSAVSTTGLVTVDPGTTFSFAGELVILLLLQIGGVGYMTVMSFFYILLRDRLSPAQIELTRSGFGLTTGFNMLRFVRRVVIATLLIEAAGAIALIYLFEQAGVEDPVWTGIFHAISAFCTAGFSLFANSLEDFRGNGAVLLIISALSYIGALGFVVFVEYYEALFVRPRRISVTTRLVLWMSFWLGLFGTAMLWAVDPVIQALPRSQQLSNAFFQAMTASTTVGFNTVPIGAMTPAAIMVVYLLMFVGASPAGTGGGLKSTTAATLLATAIASLRGADKVSWGGFRLPARRVQQAAGTLIAAAGVIFAALILLDLTGRYPFDQALFEVISALSTVGLSMGLTASLTDPGKLIITAVMFIGRVGIFAFFMAFATTAEDDDRPMPVRDVIL